MPSVETGCWWDEASGFLFAIPKLKRWLARKNHRCGTGLASLDRMNVAKSSTHERGWKINDPGIHHHITIPSSSSIVLEVPRSCGPSDCQKLSVLPSLNCSTPRFKKAHSETASQLIPTGPTKQASASRWISTDLKKKKKQHAVENTQIGEKNGPLRCMMMSGFRPNLFILKFRPPNRPLSWPISEPNCSWKNATLPFRHEP